MIELGFSDFVAEIFTALMAPAGTPPEVVSLLIGEVGKLVKDPSLVEKAERAGYEWIGAGPRRPARQMARGKGAVRGGHPVLRHQAAVTLLARFKIDARRRRRRCPTRPRWRKARSPG